MKLFPLLLSLEEQELEKFANLTPFVVFLFFSLAIALAAFIVWILSLNVDKFKKSLKTTPVIILIAGVFLAATCLFIPIYFYDAFKDNVDGLRQLYSVILGFHNSIRLFILDGDFVIIQETTAKFDNVILKNAYDGLAAVLYLSAPFLTFGFLLSFLKSLRSRFRFFIWKLLRRDLFIFNELNRKSIILAESIYREYKKKYKGYWFIPKCVIVFCEVDEKDEGDDSDLVDRANDINSIFFKTEITSLSVKGKKRKNAKVFVLPSPEELAAKKEEVLTKGLDLAEEVQAEHEMKEAFESKIQAFKNDVGSAQTIEELDTLYKEFVLAVEGMRKDYVPGEEIKNEQERTIKKGHLFVEEFRKTHQLNEATVSDKIDAFERDVRDSNSFESIKEVYDDFEAAIDRTRLDYDPSDYIPEKRKIKVHLFFMHTDPADNVRHYYDMFNRLQYREDYGLYLFSTKPASELALNHLLPGDIKTQPQRRRVTIDTFFIYRYLYNHGVDIFDNIKFETKDGKKIISVVIVGLGMYGAQFLQAMAWYCQMDGYYLKINAFDSDPLAEEKFAGMCPELMDDKHNKKIIPGDAQYDITIHPNCPIKTKKFNEEIAKITDASICFACLGNDDFNIEAAIEIRTQFERNGLHPSVHAVVQEMSSEITEGAANFKGQKYDIDFIGSDLDAYSYNSIIDSALEDEALRAHVAYSQTRRDVEKAVNEFYMYEYNYLSSCATVIHKKAKIHCHIPGMDKPSKERSKTEKDIIELLEHKRWNAWMRSRGYVWSGSIQKSTRNDLGRKHHDIVPYKELTEDEKRKDEIVSGI